MTTPSDAALADLVERDSIRDLLMRTAQCLDTEDLDGWLALFAPDSEYEITAYVPEIRTSTPWWKSDRDALAKLLAEVTQHVRDPGRRLHLVTPVSIAVDGDRARATSHFAIFRTEPSGESRVYAVGRYEDTLVKVEGSWLYEAHRAVLETRMLETLTHLPL